MTKYRIWFWFETFGNKRPSRMTDIKPREREIENQSPNFEPREYVVEDDGTMRPVASLLPQSEEL